MDANDKVLEWRRALTEYFVRIFKIEKKNSHLLQHLFAPTSYYHPGINGLRIRL